jgi:hypothetical protein
MSSGSTSKAILLIEIMSQMNLTRKEAEDTAEELRRCNYISNNYSRSKGRLIVSTIALTSDGVMRVEKAENKRVSKSLLGDGKTILIAVISALAVSFLIYKFGWNK